MGQVSRLKREKDSGGVEGGSVGLVGEVEGSVVAQLVLQDSEEGDQECSGGAVQVRGQVDGNGEYVGLG